MADAQKISGKMVLPEREYQMLYEAANDSAAYWSQAQNYLRELTVARDQMAKLGKPDATIDALCAELVESRRANKVLFVLLFLAAVCGIILGASR